MIISNEFSRDLSAVYSHQMLMNLYKKYLNKMELLVPSSYSFAKEIRNPQTNKLSKEYLLKLLTIIYTEQSLFEKFLKLLPVKIQNIFQIVVNSGEDINQIELSNKLGEKISLIPNSISYEYSGIVDLFILKRGVYYSLLLPESIKEVLRNYFLPVEHAKIKPTFLPANLTTYENKGKIVDDLERYYAYINNFTIDFTSQNKLSKSTISKIKTTLDIDEFYNTKGLDTSKTELIANFLINLKSANNKTNKSLDELKALFKNYLDEDTKFYSYTMLNHINFSKAFLDSKKDKIKNNSFSKSMWEILSSLILNKWVSFENVFDYISLNKLNIKLVLEFTAKNFYFQKYNSASEKNDRCYIDSPMLYTEAILRPSVKATLFLFSAFGLIDIAYSNHKNNIAGEDKYISPYDGLKYVRLTDLGAYILGLQKEYTYKVSSEKTGISLDKKRLIIKLSKKDNMKSVIIKNFANEINETNFIVNYGSFLKDCNNKKEIDDKISLFKNQVSNNIEGVWDNFFTEIVKKANLFEKQNKITIYKIPVDKEIIELISKDEIISQYVLKVENYQIAIRDEQFQIVFDRLKEFGYIINR